MDRFIAVAIGAALGANTRYLIDLWAIRRFGDALPLGTFIVNVTGSFLLGFLVEASLLRTSLSPQFRLLLTTGFLSSYTTFSTYIVGGLGLASAGKLGSASATIVGSVIAGIGAAILGMMLAKWV